MKQLISWHMGTQYKALEKKISIALHSRCPFISGHEGVEKIIQNIRADFFREQGDGA